MTAKIMCVIICLMLTVNTFADTITLANGTTLTGKITGYDKKRVYLETFNSDYLIIMQDIITNIEYTYGLQIKSGKIKMPDKITLYQNYEVSSKANISNIKHNNLIVYNINEGDSTNIELAYLAEMKKINENVKLVWIPLWLGLGLSLASVVIMLGNKP